MGQVQYVHEFLSIQSRGTVALPSALRRKYHLDTPGAQVEVTERPDGVIELRPTLPIPASQAWFWTEEWQAGERVVDEQIARNDVTSHDSAEEFTALLDGLDQ